MTWMNNACRAQRLILSIGGIVFLCVPPIFADTVYFKNGNILNNAVTKKDKKGIWVDGVLFEKSDIDKIEQKSVVKTEPYSQPEGHWKNQKTSSASASDIDARIKKRVEEEKRNNELSAQQTQAKAREAKQQEENQASQWTKESFSSSLKRY